MTKRFEHLTPELAATLPLPGSAAPQQMRFAPDGRALFYLLSDGDGMALSLWRYDIATKTVTRIAGPQSEGEWSADEELRRERTRMVWEGITSYEVVGTGDDETILIPQAGKLFIKRGSGLLREIPGVYDAIDPALFPEDPSRVAYVFEDEVWVADTRTGEARAVTNGAQLGVSHGLSEYAAQEELGRAEGYWVSPNSQYIAFEEADVRHIPEYPIVHWEADQAFVETHRYPLVGQPNARVRLGVVATADDGVVRWFELGEEDQYLARVAWTPANQLAVMLLSRDHHHLQWRLYDVATGTYRVLFEEESPLWVNVGDDTRFLASGDVLTTSEASGYRHLWWYTQDGRGRPITQGDFEIQRLLAYDAEGRTAYVTATKETPIEVHVYQVNVDTGVMVRISEEPGVHQAVVSPDFRYWADQSGSSLLSPQTRLVSLTSENSEVLHGHERIRPADLGLASPEFVTLTLEDGTRLYGAIYEPLPRHEKVPAIIAVYGGTHAQTVVNAWGMTVDLQAQLLRQKGFLVFKLDNRGSYHRGKDFEGALYRRFSTVEVEDQVAGVHWLVQNRRVDPTRVGIYGWSYGGYMTLMALLKASDLFKVGVAGAPVTDFRLYDTAYTERYMQTQETNLQGYVDGSVLPLVDRLSGHLLIIHGLLDENVHFRNTTLLVDALNRAEKDYDLVVLPYSRHAVRGYHNVLTVVRRRTQFFEKYL